MTLPEPYYQDDACTIYCGDCREILPLLPKVDLLLTDQPYGLKMNSGTWVALQDFQTYRSWDSEPVVGLGLVLEHGEHRIVWGGNYYSLGPARCLLSWFKPDAPPSIGQFEMAWTNLDRCSRQISWSIAATNKERNGHPTQKPLQVIRWSIHQAPNDCQTILDPFMGSGTTLRAAKDLGRRAIGIEINEEYCAIAEERLRQEVFAL